LAKERMINTQFWNDDYIEPLDPEGKLLYLYLFTNELANIAGIYEITRKRMFSDTCIPGEKIDSLIVKFEEDKKVYRLDSWVIVCNMPKHQKWQERPKIEIGIKAILKKLPSKVLKHIDTLSIPYTYPLVNLDLDLDLNLDLDPDLTGKSAKELLDYFFQKFLDKFNEKLVISGAKDMKLLKKLLETREKEKIKELIDAFFEFKDPWVMQSGYTIGVFYAVINKLLVQDKAKIQTLPPDPARIRAQQLREEWENERR
jgi:hypothetical protein